MKIKNKKLALANLIAGYVGMIAFVVLVILNRPAEEVVLDVVAEPLFEEVFDESTDTAKIILYGNDRISVRAGSIYTDPGFKAVDSEGNDISDKVVVTGLDKVDTNIPGFTYEIEYTYIDDNANMSQVSRFVAVNDNTFVVDRSIGPDRLTGVVLNDRDPVVAVVDNDDVVYVDRDRDYIVHDRDVIGSSIGG